MKILNIYWFRVNVLTQNFASGGGPWDNIFSDGGSQANADNSESLCHKKGCEVDTETKDFQKTVRI